MMYIATSSTNSSFLTGINKKSLICIVISLLSLTSCADSGDYNGGSIEQGSPKSNKESSVTSSGYKPIYVDRMIETIEGGINPYKVAYRKQVEYCEKEGLSTTRLKEDDVEKIMTQRWQLWKTADAVAYKVEEWSYERGKFENDTACHFSLTYSGQHVYMDKTHFVEADLATGDSYQWEAQPEEFEVFDTTPSEEELGKWGSWGPVWSSVDGHQCAEWTSLLGQRACYWSEAVEQGIHYTPTGAFSSLATFQTRRIALRVDPPEEGAGERLRTINLVTGEDVDTFGMKPEYREESGEGSLSEK